jgi:protein AroM
MSRVVGAVTIGQTPRHDVIPEIQAVLGAEISIVQSGALDPFTLEEVRALAPGTTGHTLVTRMRDGTEVKLGKDFLVPRVQVCIHELQNRADLILLLCTGSFPRMESKRPVLYPEHVLYNTVRSIEPQRLGVLTPTSEQVAFQCERWHKIVNEVVVEVFSPYGELEELGSATARLSRAGADLVVMDCIGYTQVMKEIVREHMRKPVLLASSLLAHLAAELLS